MFRFLRWCHFAKSSKWPMTVLGVLVSKLNRITKILFRFWTKVVCMLHIHTTFLVAYLLNAKEFIFKTGHRPIVDKFCSDTWAHLRANNST